MKAFDCNLVTLWLVCASAPVCYFVEKKFFPSGHTFFHVFLIFQLGVLVALSINELKKF